MNTSQVGQDCEKLAAEQLKREGFRILEKNYRCRLGEIDLIATRGGRLYFFEVKARGAGALGSPYEVVGRQKQQKIRRVAENYLLRHKPKVEEYCFGVVGIILSDSKPQISWLEDPFW